MKDKNRYEVIKLSMEEMNFLVKYSIHKEDILKMPFVEDEDCFVIKPNKTFDKENFAVCVFLENGNKKELMIDEELEYEFEDELSQLKNPNKILKLLTKELVGLTEYEYKGKYPEIELKREYYSVSEKYQRQGIGKLLAKTNEDILYNFLKEESDKYNFQATIYKPSLYEFTGKGILGTKIQTLETFISLARSFPHFKEELEFKHYTINELKNVIERIKNAKPILNNIDLFFGDKKDIEKISSAGFNYKEFQDGFDITNIEKDMEKNIKKNLVIFLEKNKELQDKNILFHFNTFLIGEKEFLLNGEDINVGLKNSIKDYLIFYKDKEILIIDNTKELKITQPSITLNKEIVESFTIKDCENQSIFVNQDQTNSFKELFNLLVSELTSKRVDFFEIELNEKQNISPSFY